MKEAVLITGASAGIGYDLAELFAQEKRDLVIAARNEKKLTETAAEFQKKYGTEVHVLSIDLSVPGSSKKVIEFTKSKGLFIETLVNNAGFGTNGEFAKNPMKDEMEMLQLNITSLAELTKLFLDDMISNKKGHILNVASTAAFQPGPYMSGYYASKAFVLHFSEGLSEEVREHGISVSILCPGPVKTLFQERAGMHDAALVKGPLLIDSKDVAKTAYKGLKKGKLIIIPGFMNWLLVQSVRFSPRFAVRKIAKYLNKVPA